MEGHLILLLRGILNNKRSFFFHSLNLRAIEVVFDLEVEGLEEEIGCCEAQIVLLPPLQQLLRLRLEVALVLLPHLANLQIE